MPAYSTAAKLTLTATTDPAALIAGQGAGTFIEISTLTGYNSSGSATSLDIYDGDTQIWEAIPVPSGAGFILPFSKPIRLSNNAALKVATNDSVTSVFVNATYDVK